jgi:hypothetical protein
MTQIKNNPIENRPLSSYETHLEILNRNYSTWFIVFISRIKGPLHEEIVRQALDLIQCRHPHLNSRLIGSLDNLRFDSERTQKIPLRVVNVESWQKIAVEELNEKIDSHQGLMRAVLVQTSHESNINYLITAVHHAIIDGLSCIRLHQDILTYCQQIASGTQITQLPRLSALPPIDALLPKSMKGFKGFIKSRFFLWKLMLKTLWYQPETLGFEKYVAVELRRCNLIHRQLNKTLTQRLSNVCKNKKTTVQAALCAAMLFTTAKKIVHLKKRTRVHVNCRSAVNLRRRLNPVISHEELGMLASVLPSFHTLQQNTSFWKVAREVRQELKSGLRSGDIFTNVLMSEQMLKFRLARANKATVGITNMGKVNIPTNYGPFELESIHGATSMTAFGGTFIAVVTICQGEMLINFVFSEPSISYKTMEVLADKVISYLTEVCQREDIYFLG